MFFVQVEYFLIKDEKFHLLFFIIVYNESNNRLRMRAKKQKNIWRKTE